MNSNPKHKYPIPHRSRYRVILGLRYRGGFIVDFVINFFALITPNKKPARGVDRAGHCDQRFNRGIGVRQSGGGAGGGSALCTISWATSGLVQAVRKFIVKNLILQLLAARYRRPRFAALRFERLGREFGPRRASSPIAPLDTGRPTQRGGPGSSRESLHAA